MVQIILLHRPGTAPVQIGAFHQYWLKSCVEVKSASMCDVPETFAIHLTTRTERQTILRAVEANREL